MIVGQHSLLSLYKLNFHLIDQFIISCLQQLLESQTATRYLLYFYKHLSTLYMTHSCLPLHLKFSYIPDEAIQLNLPTTSSTHCIYPACTFRYPPCSLLHNHKTIVHQVSFSFPLIFRCPKWFLIS